MFTYEWLLQWIGVSCGYSSTRRWWKKIFLSSLEFEIAITNVGILIQTFHKLLRILQDHFKVFVEFLTLFLLFKGKALDLHEWHLWLNTSHTIYCLFKVICGSCHELNLWTATQCKLQSTPLHQSFTHHQI